MRIEILIESEEPRIYPLNRQKLVIGSMDTCDIVIPHKGISRKHLVITTEEDKFFVADQGSTNGTFINEQRLIPGRKVELTSFFPVRLGDDVLISLLSDNEAQELEPESSLNNFETKTESSTSNESTRMVSLSALQKSSTANLVKKRTETVVKRKTQVQKKKAPPKKEGLSNKMVGTLCLLVIAGVAYYQSHEKKVEEDKVVAVKEHSKPQAAPVPSGPIKKVELEQLPSVESVLGAIGNPKCSGEIEKYICVTMPAVFTGKWGTVLLEKNIIIYGDGKKYANDSLGFLKGDPASDQYRSDLALISLMMWVRDNVPGDLLSFKGLENYKITIALVDTTAEAPVLVSGSMFYPESLLRLRQKIQTEHFANANKNGVSEFSFALDYLRFL